MHLFILSRGFFFLGSPSFLGEAAEAEAHLINFFSPSFPPPPFPAILKYPFFNPSSLLSSSEGMSLCLRERMLYLYLPLPHGHIFDKFLLAFPSKVVVVVHKRHFHLYNFFL